MDSLSVLKKDYEKVSIKLKELEDNVSNIDDLISAVDENKDLDPATFLTQLKLELTSISSSHKEWHGAISRFGKSIDKNLTENVSFFANKGMANEKNAENYLHQLIAEHFLRQGQLDIVDKFVAESGYHLDENKKQPFIELNKILEALHNHSTAPALEWCEKNRAALKKKNSYLEFMLHQLNFILLLKEKKTIEALQYGQKLGQYANEHKKQLQRLMGSLLYINEIEDSVYSDLVSPMHWIEICELFVKDACSLLGLSKESPLAITVDSGCRALPALNSIRQVMEAKQLWGLKDELPCEVDLGPQYQYHSLFACPILRAQCTKFNPPMRLECGHVISIDALKRLTISSKVKCPYCPQENNPNDAKQVYF